MTVAFVNSAQTHIGNAVYTPTAGNDIIVQVLGFAGTGTGSSLTSLTDSVGGDTVLTDLAYADDTTSGVGIAVFRIHNATAVSHTFTPVWGTAPSNWFISITEASGISGLDTGAGTITLAHGSTATPTTNSLSPPANGDFVIAIAGQATSTTVGSWTNGFTTAQSFGSGPTWASAYLVQATAASVNAAISNGGSAPWAAALVAYSATGGGPPGAGAISMAGTISPMNLGITPGLAKVRHLERQMRDKCREAVRSIFLPRYRSVHG
jgi:hypothetical protein